MDREELYELLDIDTPADFEYFENLAALLECDEYLEYEDIYALMEGVDKDTFSGLVDNYFDEITDFIPGDMAELYTLLEKIKFSENRLTNNFTVFFKYGNLVLVIK